MHRRFWGEPDLALKMWLVHNEALLSFARAYPEDTLAVSVDMIRDGFPLTWMLDRVWRLGLADVPTAEVFDPSVTAGRSARQAVSDRRLVGRVEATWRALGALARRTEGILEKEVSLAG